MSTHSNIAVKLENGAFLSIYVHSDGYYEWMGKMLMEHYNSAERANAIVALGDASCIYPSLAKPAGHSINSRAPECSVFYGRDLNMSEFGQNIYTDEQALLENSDNHYLYVWQDGHWFAREHDRLILLADVLNSEGIAWNGMAPPVEPAFSGRRALAL